MAKNTVLLFAFLLVVLFATGQVHKPGFFLPKEEYIKFFGTDKLSADKDVQLVYKPATEYFYSPNPLDNEAWVYDSYNRYSYNIAGKAEQCLTRNAADQNLSLITSSFYPDPYGYEAEKITQVWNINSWENNSKETNVYDSRNKLIEYKNYFWQNNAWYTTGGTQYEYIYDGEKIISQTSKYYHQEISNFIYSSRIVYTYNLENKMTGILTQGWSGGQWKNYYQELYTWNNNTITEILNYTYSDGLLYDSTKYSNVQWHSFTTENSQWEGLFASYTMQVGDNGNWIAHSKYDWEYDEYLSSVRITQVFNTETQSWYYESRFTESYDSHLNYTGNRYESWNNGSWEIGFETKYTLLYDGNNNLITKIKQEWDSYENALLNQAKSVYGDFIPFSSIEETSLSGVKIFPNPSENYIIIEIPGGDFLDNSLTCCIYDIAGKLIRTTPIRNIQTGIDISTLAPSVYFIKITDNGVILSNVKLMKQ